MSHREDASVALVVPSYPKHFPQAVNLAKSIARYVINSMMLYVATTDAEREAFTAALAQASTSAVSLQDAANVTVRTLWEACQCGADAGGDRDFLAENERQLRAGGSGLMDKFVMQSSKKVLGAMCVNARFVLFTDSESIFVRQVDLAADALRLASWPRRILYDSPARPRNSDWRRNIGSGVRSTALSTVEQFFNVSTGHRYYGFSLGYYWLFSRELVRDFLVYCRRSRHGSYWRSVLKLAVSNNPLNDLVGSDPARVWFGELALFVFMLHVHPKRANYLPTDAQALLTTFVPRLAVFQIEHLHCCVRKEHHAGLARLYASLNGSWPVWMADTDPALHDGTLGLLRSTKQIYLLTSQQAGFVEYAIGVGDEWASSSGRPSRGARQPAAADETASSQPQFCPTPEPDVALLVGGMERGLLSEPRMWLSLRRNVLDQFAPRTSELLLFLKTFEWQVGDAWQPSSSRGSLLRTSTATDEEAARRTWARALEVLRPTAVEFANQSEVDALQLRLSRCHKYTPGDGIRPMLGYLHTLQQLWRLTTKREKERGSPFEVVMFMRPDMIHYFSCGAHCLYEAPTTVYHSVGSDCAFTVYAGGRDSLCGQFSGLDFWWLGPRRYAGYLGSSLARVLSCGRAYVSNEHVLAEALSHAQKEFGLRVRADANSYLGASVLWRPAGLPRSGVQGIGTLARLNHTRPLAELVYGGQAGGGGAGEGGGGGGPGAGALAPPPSPTPAGWLGNLFKGILG